MKIHDTKTNNTRIQGYKNTRIQEYKDTRMLIRLDFETTKLVKVKQSFKFDAGYMKRKPRM